MVEELFTASTIRPEAQQPNRGVCFPTGDRIIMDVNDPHCWIVKNALGATVGRIRDPIETVLIPPRFTSDQEDRAFKALAGLNRHEQEALWYAGYIVDHLYLQAPGRTTRAYDNAARLARLLIRYWSQRADQGDRRAVAALPMLWRSYWLALDHVLSTIETNLKAEDKESSSEPCGQATDGGRQRQPAADGSVAQTSADSCSSAHFAKPIEQRLRRPDQYIQREQETARLTGWVVELNFGHEYNRALHAWQDVCLDEAKAWFFIDWLAPWLDRNARSWQALREEELQTTIFQADQGPKALRSPGVELSESRARLEFLVDQ